MCEEEQGGRGLAEITGVLTTPALGGLPLTKWHLAALGRELGLPVGFGEKRLMLTNMFRAAADQGRLPELIQRLQGEAERWRARYAAWSTEYPASTHVWHEWRERLEGARQLLEEMARTVVEAQVVGPGVGGGLPEPADQGTDYED